MEILGVIGVVITTILVVLVALSPIILGISIGMLISAHTDGYLDAARTLRARDYHRGLARWTYRRGYNSRMDEEARIKARNRNPGSY
jgi:hypothetical protein